MALASFKEVKMSNFLKFLQTRIPVAVLLAFAIPLMRPVIQTSPLPDDMQVGFLGTLIVVGLIFGGYKPESEAVGEPAPAAAAAQTIRNRIITGGKWTIGLLLAIPALVVVFCTLGQLMMLIAMLYDISQGARSIEVYVLAAGYSGILALTVGAGFGIRWAATKWVLK
jgi:hypothetical protein